MSPQLHLSFPFFFSFLCSFYSHSFFIHHYLFLCLVAIATSFISFFCFIIPMFSLFLFFFQSLSFSSSCRHNDIFHFLLTFLCFLFTFFSLHIVIFSLVLSLLIVSPPCNFLHFRFSSVLFLVFPATQPFLKFLSSCSLSSSFPRTVTGRGELRGADGINEPLDVWPELRQH